MGDVLQLKAVQLSGAGGAGIASALQREGYTREELSANPEILAFVAMHNGISEWDGVQPGRTLVVPKHASRQMTIDRVLAQRDFYVDAMARVPKGLEAWRVKFAAELNGPAEPAGLAQPRTSGATARPAPTGLHSSGSDVARPEVSGDLRARMENARARLEARRAEEPGAPDRTGVAVRSSDRLATRPGAMAMPGGAGGQPIPARVATLGEATRLHRNPAEVGGTPNERPGYAPRPGPSRVNAPDVQTRLGAMSHFWQVLTGQQRAAPLPSGTAVLSWTPPTHNAPPDSTPLTDLKGYKVYYGTTSGNLDTSIDVGNVTSFTVSDLPVDQTYYFAVTAYNAGDAESEKTGEVSKLVR